jgi:hypothetical protein
MSLIGRDGNDSWLRAPKGYLKWREVVQSVSGTDRRLRCVHLSAKGYAPEPAGSAASGTACYPVCERGRLKR